MDRDENGRFGRTCGSVLHDGDRGSLHITDLRKGKGISAKNYQLLLKQGVVLKYTHYICRDCLQYLYLKQEKTNLKAAIAWIKIWKRSEVKFYEKIIDVATKIEGEISVDAKNQNHSKSFEDIIEFDPAKWLYERPDNLLHLITALCNVDFNTTTPCKIILIYKIVELIYM